jgi:hypothetical protein
MIRILGPRVFATMIAFLALQIASWPAARIAHAQELPASQLVTPAELTPIERDYYNSATDPQVKKNFLITRSYVRIAQKVVDKKLPPEAFPAIKPKGFSVQYLLPDDPSLINQAMGLSLAKDWGKCLDAKAPGCR